MSNELKKLEGELLACDRLLDKAHETLWRGRRLIEMKGLIIEALQEELSQRGASKDEIDLVVLRAQIKFYQNNLEG